MPEEIPKSDVQPEVAPMESGENGIESKTIEERVDWLTDAELDILDDLPPPPDNPIQEEAVVKSRTKWIKAIIVASAMAAVLAGGAVQSEAGQFGSLGKLAGKVGTVVKDKAEAAREKVQNKIENNKEEDKEATVTKEVSGAKEAAGAYVEFHGILSNAEVEAAIAKGKTEKPEDIGAQIGVSMVSNWIGSRITIYTPEKWIELLSAEAKEQYRKMTIKDVTAEMRAPVLRIIVPRLGVERLILLPINNEDDSVQASKTKDSEISTMPAASGVRGSNTGMAAMEFQFPMSNVEAIRKAGDGRFRIVAQGIGTTVMGIIRKNPGFEKMEKKISVEYKHLKNLS